MRVHSDGGGSADERLFAMATIMFRRRVRVFGAVSLQ